MKKLRHFTGAIPFFAAVFLNAFVDLGHKIVIQNTVFKLYDGPTQIMLTALVLAQFAFSPAAIYAAVAERYGQAALEPGGLFVGCDCA